MTRGTENKELIFGRKRKSCSALAEKKMMMAVDTERFVDIRLIFFGSGNPTPALVPTDRCRITELFSWP